MRPTFFCLGRLLSFKLSLIDFLFHRSETAAALNDTCLSRLLPIRGVVSTTVKFLAESTSKLRIPVRPCWIQIIMEVGPAIATVKALRDAQV